MKKSIFFYSYMLAFAILFAGCRGCNKKGGETPAVVITYENGAAVPDYEKLALNTYQTAPNAKIDEATAVKNIQQLLEYAGAAKEFDMANAVKDNDMLWYKNPKDPSAILNANLANGDISLNRGMGAYAGNSSTPGLVKNEEAVKLAMGIIQKLEFAKGEENAMITGHVGGVNMTIHDDKNGDKIYEKLTAVRFDRKLDDIPVLGHTRLLLQLGSNGTVQSLVKQWTPLSRTAVNMASEVAAKDAVKKQIEEQLIRENKGAVKIIIKKISLIYYDTGKGILEPALHIIAEVQVPAGKDGTTRNYKHDMVEPLLKNYHLSYTSDGEKHTMPKETDTVDNNSQQPRGADERK